MWLLRHAAQAIMARGPRSANRSVDCACYLERPDVRQYVTRNISVLGGCVYSYVGTFNYSLIGRFVYAIYGNIAELSVQLNGKFPYHNQTCA
jgi:hypothetical protein